MADRIVLLREGLVEQQGAPLELYERPATRYVAGFLGSPPMNFVPAQWRSGAVVVGGTALPLPAPRAGMPALPEGMAVLLGLRPEHIGRVPQGGLRAGLVRHSVRIDLLLPTGARTYATFALGGVPVVAELQAHDVSAVGETVELAIDMNRAVLIDPKTERVIGTG